MSDWQADVAGCAQQGERILIAGQQRVTALMAALLGSEVVTRGYRTMGRNANNVDNDGPATDLEQPAVQVAPHLLVQVAAPTLSSGA